MFNICCDEKIPFAKDAFSHVGNVTYRKGNRLTSTDLKEVDLLLIRSGTKVDSSLLDTTPVQFVASATAGTDHVDKQYLAKRGIPFYHAPGCNADSVVEYITSALYSLSASRSVSLQGKRVGIIGVGNVGSRLAKRLQALGLEVVVSDPPLLESNPEKAKVYTFLSLDELAATSDIITLHVPLVRQGTYPTFHLFDQERLLEMKQGAWLLNASRGAVVSNNDLRAVLDAGHLGAVVLDVWEGEPEIDDQLLQKVDIGTAHIAGYSYEGKVNGTIMIYQACLKHYGIAPAWNWKKILEASPQDDLDLTWPAGGSDPESIIQHLAKHMYSVQEDADELAGSLDLPANERAAWFLKLRKEYRRRRSFGQHTLHATIQQDSALVKMLKDGLGIQVAPL